MRRAGYTGVFGISLWLAGCGSPEPAPPPANSPPQVVSMPAPAAEDLELPSGPGAITPSLTWAGGALRYLWQEEAPAAAGGGAPVKRVLMSQRRDGAWSAPVELARGAEVMASWADAPALAVSEDGSLVAHWLRETAESYEPVWIRSTDGGATWATLTSPFPAGLRGERGFVSYTSTADGLLVFWLDGRDGGEGHHGSGATALRTARLTDATFSPEQVVDGRVCDCCSTDSFTIGDAPTVVYRDRDEVERRDVSSATRLDSTWTAGATLGAEGWTIEGCPVNGPAADARGESAVAAWFSGAQGGQAVAVAFSQGGGPFSAAVPVARAEVGARPIGRVDVLLDGDGTALVLWISAEGEDGRLRLRRVAPDGRVSAPVDLAAGSTARASGFPRLGWDGDRVVVAWTAPGGGNRAVTFPPAFVPAVEGPLAPSPTTAAPATLPAFAAAALDGKSLSATELRGSAVLINLWATWCEPCREELPALLRLQSTHPGLRVITASVDGAASGAMVRKLVDRLAPGLTVLHPDGGLGAALGVAAVPQTYLFDGEQRLVWASNGVFDPKDPAFVAALAGAGVR